MVQERGEWRVGTEGIKLIQEKPWMCGETGRGQHLERKLNHFLKKISQINAVSCHCCCCGGGGSSSSAVSSNLNLQRPRAHFTLYPLHLQPFQLKFQFPNSFFPLPVFLFFCVLFLVKDCFKRLLEDCSIQESLTYTHTRTLTECPYQPLHSNCFFLKFLRISKDIHQFSCLDGFPSTFFFTFRICSYLILHHFPSQFL